MLTMLYIVEILNPIGSSMLTMLIVEILNPIGSSMLICLAQASA